MYNTLTEEIKIYTKLSIESNMHTYLSDATKMNGSNKETMHSRFTVSG